MSRLEDLRAIGVEHGWTPSELKFVDGQNGGYLFTRAGEEVQVRTDRLGRISDIRRFNHYNASPTRALCTRYEIARAWLTATPAREENTAP